MSPVWSAALLAGLAVAVVVGLPAPARLGPPVRRLVGPLAAGWRRGHIAMAGCVLLLLSGPVAALIAALAAWGGGRWWANRRRAELRRAERDGAAEALAVLVAELRAGRPTAVACEGAAEVATGPLAVALRAVGDSARFGADPAACLLAQVDDSAVPELLRALAACWQVCAGTGSSLAAAVERLGDGLAADRAQQLLVDAELAGPQATAVLLALLPGVGLLLAAGLGAQPLQLLLHTPVGWACLSGGLLLDAAGLWWTSRLVAAARRA